MFVSPSGHALELHEAERNVFGALVLRSELVLVDGEGEAHMLRRLGHLSEVLVEQAEHIVGLPSGDVGGAHALLAPLADVAEDLDALGALGVAERGRSYAVASTESSCVMHLYQMSTTLSYMASAFSILFIE